MNAKGKTIQVNASSLVDLKAELLRKQEEFKKARLQNASRAIRPKPQTKKAAIWSKQNAGVLERAQRDAEVRQEEEQTTDKARTVLEAKAKLYEQMTSGQALEEGEGNERFLVDFERKAVSTILERREEEKRRNEEQIKKKEEEAEAEEERRRLAEKVPPSDDPDEQWVDFVDGFGRERRCLRKDLPALKKLDESIAKSARTQPADKAQEPELLSTDMRREMQRQKWEKEQEEMLAGQSTVHYANLQFDEIRAHGVGFYQFSKKEQERQEQLKMLDQLRQQTLENRVKKERMLEKRKAVMKARLAKVKQRRLQREGKTADDDADNTDEDDWTIGPKPEKPSAPEPLTRDETLKKDAPMRDWDRGKPAVGTAPNWLEEQRAEREPDFAPPQMYNETAIKSATQRKYKQNPLIPREGKRDWREGKQDWRERKQEASMADSMEGVIGEGISAIRAGMEQREGQAGGVSSIPLPPQPRDERGCHHSPRESETCTGSDLGTRIPPWSQSDPHPSGWDPVLMSHTDHNTTLSHSNIPVGLSTVPPYATGTAMPMPPYFAGNYMPVPPCPANTGVPMPPCPVGIAMPMPPYPAGIDMSVPPPSDAVWMPPQAVSTPAQIDTTLQGITPTTCLSDTDALGSTPSGELLTASSIQQPPEAAPQPAHYTSAPKKSQPKQGHYERVNMHQVPMSLPVPPIIGQEVKYPSMESVFGKKPEKREEDSIKYWKRQFGASQPKGGAAVNQIPFPAPNIQKAATKDDSAITDFDLSKPPPNIKKKN